MDISYGGDGPITWVRAEPRYRNRHSFRETGGPEVAANSLQDAAIRTPWSPDLLSPRCACEQWALFSACVPPLPCSSLPRRGNWSENVWIFLDCWLDPAYPHPKCPPSGGVSADDVNIHVHGHLASVWQGCLWGRFLSWVVHLIFRHLIVNENSVEDWSSKSSINTNSQRFT